MKIIVTERRLTYAVTELWNKIKDTFARISHTHSIAQIEGLSNAMNSKSSVGHRHEMSAIVGLVQALNEIRSMIQPTPDKEVVSVLSAGDTMPDNPSDGDRWIDLYNNLLYYYSEDDGWETEDSDSASVYITADTSHIYVWNGSEFVDSSGQPVDNTLYVANTTTALAQYTEKCMYNVCVVSRNSNTWYTMTVSVQLGKALIGRPQKRSYTQLLMNNDGWLVRTKVNDGEWSEWKEHTYSYVGHTHEQADVDGLAAALDEIRALIQPAPEKEVVNVLSAGDTMPDNPSDGDRWIDLYNNLLYYYSEDDGWETEDSDSASVYITADTSHIYVWNGSEFVDSSGQPVDNTLYVANTTTALAQYTEKCMYNVCVVSRNSNTWYTMTVSVQLGKALIGRPQKRSYTQLLMNNDGWLVRTKVNDGEWSEWEEHVFSYEGHGHVQSFAYAQLVQLCNQSKLVPGTWYRMVDFVTKVANDPEARSAEHPFDLLLFATSENEFSEKVRPLLTSRSGGDYFRNSNLQAWEVWYSLANDTTRFMWADEENGKGVIYRMVDEFGNDCPYDLKNVQFKRYRVSDDNGYHSDLEDLYIGLNANMNGLSMDDSDFVWCYTLSLGDRTTTPVDASLLGFNRDDLGDGYGQKGYYGGHSLQPATCSVTVDDEVNSVFCLNNVVVFMNNDLYRAGTTRLGSECINMTLSSGCVTIEADNMNIVMGPQCYDLSIGIGCYELTFSQYCHDMSFSQGSGGMSFSQNCGGMSFSQGCRRMSFSQDCWGMSFSQGCCDMSFSQYCHDMSFSQGCRRMSFSQGCNNINVDAGVHDLQLPAGASNIHIFAGVNGSRNQPLGVATNADYTQFVAMDSNGNIRIFNPADAV